MSCSMNSIMSLSSALQAEFGLTKLDEVEFLEPLRNFLENRKSLNAELLELLEAAISEEFVIIGVFSSGLAVTSSSPGSFMRIIFLAFEVREGMMIS